LYVVNGQWLKYSIHAINSERPGSQMVKTADKSWSKYWPEFAAVTVDSMGVIP